MPTAYEQFSQLTEDLEGKSVRLEYLSTSRSRTWRRGSMVITRYVQDLHLPLLSQLEAQEGWHRARFVEEKL